MKLYDRKREIFTFRPSVLTYQLNLYQHKQIHANPTLVVERGRVSAAQVAALDPCLPIPENVKSFVGI